MAAPPSYHTGVAGAIGVGHPPITAPVTARATPGGQHCRHGALPEDCADGLSQIGGVIKAVAGGGASGYASD